MARDHAGQPVRWRIAPLLTGVWVSSLAMAAAASALADETVARHFAIQAQPLASALRAYAEQTGDQVVFFSDIGKDKQSGEVVGDFTSDIALAKMLARSGLSFERLDTHTIVIAAAKPPAATAARWSKTSLTTEEDPAQPMAQATSSDSPAATAGPAPVTPAAPPTDELLSELDEVVVTGTHIRGELPAGSSLRVYSHQVLEQSGAGTVDQFARQMTENFSGADTVANTNSNIGNSRFNGGGINNGFQGASFDLHGLGPTATLTLLNGHRLAPGGYDGSLVDMSQIPLSAVDHIEVLADGASAIYGADAVAGVVNIVTRKDFNGAETQLRYADSTGGGATEYTGSQLLGTSWGSGNALINYEYDKQNGLDASERDYIPAQGGPDLLIPANRRNSLLASASQSLAQRTTLSVDAIYSDREYGTAQFTNAMIGTSGQHGSGNSRLAGVTGALDQGLWGDWHTVLTVNYSKVEQRDHSVGHAAIFTFVQDSTIVTDTRSNLIDADLLATGSVFSLPAGPIKAAVGASYRREKFDTSTYDDINDAITTYAIPTLRRRVSSAYAELAIPLIGSANALTWTRRLELSAAARYDDYSDFGSTTNPKLGLLWEPVTGFSLRGTYGKSYRAPLLDQLGALQQFFADPVPNPSSPSGTSDLLILNGGNQNLRPERATSYTAGFDVKPAVLPGFNFSATYFHTAFRDRIAAPPVAGGNYFGDPVVAPFLTVNPPLSSVESYFKSPGFVGDYAGAGPTGVDAIFDNRLANIVTSTQSGIDLSAAWSVTTDYGNFGASANVTRLINYDFQALATAPGVSLVNTFGEPLKWKGRGALRWGKWGFTSMLSVNYVNSYENTLFTPAVPISSWVTEDVYLGYDFGKAQSSYALRNLRLAVTIQNLTNRQPPYATLPPLNLLPGQHPVPYDSANASPLGRLIAVQLTKRW